MTPPASLTAAAAEVFGTFRALGQSVCLIGGLAVIRWGQPRTTQDVDITVLVPFGDEASFVDRVLTRLRPRTAGARSLAIERRVLLAVASNGVKVDISLGGLSFEHEVLARSSAWSIVEGETLSTCSPEDLVIYKLVAARPQDLVDVTGVVERQGKRLDADRIRRWGHEFAALKEDPDLLVPFEQAWLQFGQR